MQHLDRGREIWVLYRELYARGTKTGVFREIEPTTQIAMGWAAVHGFVQLAHSERLPQCQADNATFAALRDALLEGQLRSLRA